MIQITNEQILKTAMMQSAIDMNCNADDFLLDKNKVIISKENTDARRYLKLPFAANLVSYGNNIIASCSSELCAIVEEYISSFVWYHCFETPNMHVLSQKLRPLGFDVCFMAEYWLPDMNKLFSETESGKKSFTTKILVPCDFQNLYVDEWSNALCADRKNLDVLAVAAFDSDSQKLVGLAGCSADCDTMWQIGIDVLPDFRRKGIASTLTRELAKETLLRGKIPFYCCAWSNIVSARNAINYFRLTYVKNSTTQPTLQHKFHSSYSKKDMFRLQLFLQTTRNILHFQLHKELFRQLSCLCALQNPLS